MIVNQAYIFLVFIINGFLIGILFDIFRILRRSFKTKDIITCIEDILFWILTGLLLLFSIFTFSNGEIRLYMFFGVFIGCILYMILISHYFITLNVKIILIIKNIVKKLLSIILFPLKIVFDILKKLFCKPINIVTVNLKKLQKNTKEKMKNLIFFDKNKINNKKTKIFVKKEGVYQKK